jgi:hypothetical protein
MTAYLWGQHKHLHSQHAYSLKLSSKQRSGLPPEGLWGSPIMVSISKETDRQRQSQKSGRRKKTFTFVYNL